MTSPKNFEPMLATSLLKPLQKHDDDTVYAAMKKLRYPVIAQTKLDGIRCLVINGKLMSRTLKPIPSTDLQVIFRNLPEGLDGELYCEDLPFNEIDSIVMSERHKDKDKIQFWAFDSFEFPKTNYISRWSILKLRSPKYNYIYPDSLICNDAEALLAYEAYVIDQMGEGICFRTLDSPYKYGRSTLNEQYLVKLSRFTREEVTVIGFEEQQHNGNKEKRNEVGKMKRQTLQRNMINTGLLGAFIVRNSEGIEFKVGSGMTNEQRLQFWNYQDTVGQTITIKHKACGRKTKPRNPVFIGVRKDLSGPANEVSGSQLSQ